MNKKSKNHYFTILTPFLDQPFHLPTSVHKDVTERLKRINPSLYREVGLVLEQNKQERHWRGGEATRQKYIQKREEKTNRNA